VKIEDDPLDMHEGTVQNAVSVSIRHLEDVVLAAGGAVLRYGAVRSRLRRDGGDGAQAATPPGPTGQWLLVMGASGRCGASHRIGRGAAGAGCVQRRRRRAGTGQILAALSGGVWVRSRPAGSPRGWRGCWPGRAGDRDDRGTWVLQPQSQE
jgi:hypothetical protein